MLLTVLASSGVALAITYGQPDGNKHPNVGALVGTFDGQTWPLLFRDPDLAYRLPNSRALRRRRLDCLRHL